MSRLSRNYLGLTFLIMLICWGTCFLCSLAGISLENNKLLYLPYLLGGLSPTIASYLALRRSGGTANLKEWLKSIFDFKHNIFSYLMVVVVAVMFILPQCLISGYENGAPVFAIIVMVPMMMICGCSYDRVFLRFSKYQRQDKNVPQIDSVRLAGQLSPVEDCPPFLLDKPHARGYNIWTTTA